MASAAYRHRLRALLGGMAAALLLLVGASGCVHPCLALAEEICECEPTQAEREACKRQARRDFDRARGVDTDAARATCEELLDRCDCVLMDTEQGKRDCGLAL